MIFRKNWVKNEEKRMGLLKTENKQCSNCTKTSQQPYNDSNRRYVSTNCFACIHIIFSEPLLWCDTLGTNIIIRLQIEEAKRLFRLNSHNIMEQKKSANKLRMNTLNQISNTISLPARRKVSAVCR